MNKCKWEQDEVCVNASCPLCADFCPVIDTPGVCKHEERRQVEQNVIHLWLDGYDCNGDHGDPSRCGVYEAETLRDAVSMWANEKPDRWKYINMDRNPPSFWGCSFFDKKR